MSLNIPDSDALKAKYAEIAALKKAIDEKKMVKYASTPYPASSSSSRARGGYRGATRGYSTGYSRDFVHRNMTVIFNSGSDTSSHSQEKIANDANGSTEQTYVSTVSKGGMSLVHTKIYEKDKSKLIKQAENLKNLKEKIKEQKRLNAMKNRISRYRTKTDNCDRIKIDGDIFAITKNGNKLFPLTVPTGEKSKTVAWNNKTYQRKHNGTLKCQSGRRARVPIDQCRYFTRTGLCQKGSNCKYKHDPSHIRICCQHLLNNCYNKHCLFSHNCKEYNTPLCRYYLENKCANPECHFQHHKPEHYDNPNYEIWACRPFAIGGWCERGSKCPFLHLFNCPDFEEDGTCVRGKSCNLSHPVTVRTQRLMIPKNNKYQRPESDEVLVQSDTDEQEKEPKVINSYTVDSDLLFVTSKKGKYDIYIDNVGTSLSTNTFKENSEFMIQLSDSDDGETISSDDDQFDELEENNDYIKF